MGAHARLIQTGKTWHEDLHTLSHITLYTIYTIYTICTTHYSIYIYTYNFSKDIFLPTIIVSLSSSFCSSLFFLFFSFSLSSLFFFSLFLFLSFFLFFLFFLFFSFLFFSFFFSFFFVFRSLWAARSMCGVWTAGTPSTNGRAAPGREWRLQRCQRTSLWPATAASSPWTRRTTKATLKSKSFHHHLYLHLHLHPIRLLLLHLLQRRMKINNNRRKRLESDDAQEKKRKAQKSIEKYRKV